MSSVSLKNVKKIYPRVDSSKKEEQRKMTVIRILSQIFDGLMRTA